jgi:hypothetical protein
MRRICQDPLVHLRLYRIGSDEKGWFTVHIIITVSPITFDEIISRDSWIVHLLLEPVAWRLRLVMIVMSLYV